jgi:hypothetical protein
LGTLIGVTAGRRTFGSAVTRRQIATRPGHVLSGPHRMRRK